jgi:hypothetical protein
MNPMRAVLLSTLLAVLLAGCDADSNRSVPEPVQGTSPPIQTLDNPGRLTDLEMAAVPPDMEDSFPEPMVGAPAVPLHEAKKVQLRLISESGYLNSAGLYMVDVLEGDMAYLTVKVETPEGRAVSGARPGFKARGTSRISEVSSNHVTDDAGMVDFGLIGGAMGEDRVTVSVGSATTEVLVNFISLKAAGFAGLMDVNGALPWSELKKARVSYKPEHVEASFPASVAQHGGQQVKLVGFMMPLEPEEEQKRFLLTSSPPSCFFHVPGGPAGAIEVFSDKGIEASWDPIILEERLELVAKSEMGVIYRLHGARRVKS